MEYKGYFAKVEFDDDANILQKSNLMMMPTSFMAKLLI